MLQWIKHYLGLDNGSGVAYLFWSGFFSDVTIFTAALMGIRHINCHTKGCWRVGRHTVENTPYKVCAKCHPIVPNKGASRFRIHETHNRSKEEA